MSVCYSGEDGQMITLATDTFIYTSDPSIFLAQHIASNANDATSILNAENIYASLLNIPVEEGILLDKKLATSFRKLNLPQNWTLHNYKAKQGLHFELKLLNKISILLSTTNLIDLFYKLFHTIHTIYPKCLHFSNEHLFRGILLIVYVVRGHSKSVSLA